LLLRTIPVLEAAGAQLIVGACSEIPTVLNQAMLGLPFIDMMDLLAKETVAHCYGAT
jgi:aspartate racemase